MRHDSARLVSSLIEAAARAGARSALKSRILELAKLAQVVPDQQFLLRTVAKSLTETVEKIFGPLSLILVLTEPGRRQVYFAVLARLAETAECNPANDNWRRDLLKRFLLDSNEDLVASVYGTCPNGFVRILTRLGDTARHPSVYTGLFDLLREAPFLGPALVAAPQHSLTDRLFELLVALPRTPSAMDLASRFKSMDGHRRFMRVYCLLAGEKALREDHAARICAGESPAHLLESLYLSLPFPPAAVSMVGVRHISNGTDLVATSKTFGNCLRNYVPEAIRGERQYYVWVQDGEPAVVFALAADHPFGWCLSESRLARNERVPSHLVRELERRLELQGVRPSGTLEEMMQFFPNATEEAEMDEFFAQLENELEAA